MKKMTSEDILIKAMNVFSKKGISATVTDIALGCKISPGTIYYYFKDKEELLFETAYYVAKKVSGAIEAVLDPAADTETNYKNALRSVIGFTKKNIKMATFYAHYQSSYLHMKLTDLQLNKIADLCPMWKFFNEGIQKGDIKDIPLVILVAYMPVYTYVLHIHKYKLSTPGQEQMLIDSLWQAISAK